MGRETWASRNSGVQAPLARAAEGQVAAEGRDPLRSRRCLNWTLGGPGRQGGRLNPRPRPRSQQCQLPTSWQERVCTAAAFNPSPPAPLAIPIYLHTSAHSQAHIHKHTASVIMLLAVAAPASAAATGSPARPRSARASAAAAAVSRPRRPAAAAAATAAAASPRGSPSRRCGTSRRDFLKGMFKASAASVSLLGSVDELAAAPLSRSLSSAVAGSSLPRSGSGLPRAPSGLPRTNSSLEPMQRRSSVPRGVAQELAGSSNILPLPLKPLSPLAGGALRGASPITHPEPRVLQVCLRACVCVFLLAVRASSMAATQPVPPAGKRSQVLALPLPYLVRKDGTCLTSPAPPPALLQLQSTAELEQMVVSHTRRLLVVSLALNACPFSDAMMPWLAHSAQRHPDALFLRLAVDAAADEGTERLLSALSISALPVTLLLGGQQLLARLEAVGTGAGGRPPEAAAREAALELHSAIMAAKLQARLQHADCAPAAAAAPAPCLVYA